MNFDIKYATYLQIFNFIKIKQDLDVFLGTQRQRSIAKALSQTGYKLGILNLSADKWDPPARERRQFSLKIKKGKVRCTQTSSFKTCGAHCHAHGSYRPRPYKDNVDLN